MIRIIWRTDAHLADEAPQSRTDDWAESILGKLEQVGQMKANLVLDGGDLFHVKTPRLNSHSLMQRVIDVHSRYRCPVAGNIGNHDVKYGQTRYLQESPLEVLFQAGTLRRCYDEHELRVVDFGNRVQCFSAGPSASRGSFKDPKLVVRVVGIPYHGAKYDMNRFRAITKGDEDFLVVMAHCLASPAGGTLFQKEDVIRYGDLAGLDPDLWCFSHWHKNQGITEIAKGKWVVNVGSMSRGSIAEDDLKRTPVVVSMTFGDGEVALEEIPLDVKPASEVFDLEGRVRRESRGMTVDAFVESVKETFDEDHRMSIEDQIREMTDVPLEIREKAWSYLEQARANG